MKTLSFFLSLLAVTSSAHAASMERGGRGPLLSTQDELTATDEVRAIAVAGDRVLAATRGGVSVHARDTGQSLFVLSSRHGLAGNSSTAVRVLENGDVLIGGEFGVTRLRGIGASHSAAEVKVAPVLTGARADLYDPVVAITSRGGETFVVGQRSGPRRYRPRSLSLEPAEADRIAWRDAAPTYHGWWLGGISGRLEHRVQGKVTESLELGGPLLDLADEEPYLLIATGERLMRLAHGQLTELRDLNIAGPVPAVAFATTRSRETLVAARTGSVYTTVDGDLTRLATVGGEPTALLGDGSTLWLGIRGQGLTRVDLDSGRVAAVRRANEICSNHVTHVTEHSGALIIGTFDEGACALIDGEWRTLKTASRFVLGLASDGADLYIASSNGISRFDARLAAKPIGSRDGRALRWLANTAATGAAELGDGTVALSSAYGVVKISRRANGSTRARFHDREDGTVPLKITGLAASGAELFVASETQGVSRLGWSKRPAARYLDPVALPEAWVTALSADGPDRVWVGTCQSGIARVRQDQATRIQERDGLPDNRVTAVTSDGVGAFVGTLWGLAYVDDDGSVTVYGHHADPRSASLRQLGSTLWHGTESGLVRFEYQSPRIVMAEFSE